MRTQFVVYSQLFMLFILPRSLESSFEAGESSTSGQAKWVIRAETASREDKLLLRNISSLTFKHVLNKVGDSCRNVVLMNHTYQSLCKDSHKSKQEMEELKKEIGERICVKDIQTPATCGTCYQDSCFKSLIRKCRLEIPGLADYGVRNHHGSAEFGNHEKDYVKVQLKFEFEYDGGRMSGIDYIDMDDKLQNINSLFQLFDDDFLMFEQMVQEEFGTKSDLMKFDKGWDVLAKETKKTVEEINDIKDQHLTGEQKEFAYTMGGKLLDRKQLNSDVSHHYMQTTSFEKVTKSKATSPSFKLRREIAEEDGEMCQKYSQEGIHEVCPQFVNGPECVKKCGSMCGMLQNQLQVLEEHSRELNKNTTRITSQMRKEYDLCRAFSTKKIQKEEKHLEVIRINSIEVDPSNIDRVFPWLFNDVKVNFTVVQGEENTNYPIVFGTTEATLKEPSNLFNLFPYNSTIPLAKAVIDHLKKRIEEYSESI